MFIIIIPTYAQIGSVKINIKINSIKITPECFGALVTSKQHHTLN